MNLLACNKDNKTQVKINVDFTKKWPFKKVKPTEILSRKPLTKVNQPGSHLSRCNRPFDVGHCISKFVIYFEVYNDLSIIWMHKHIMWQIGGTTSYNSSSQLIIVIIGDSASILQFIKVHFAF